MTGNPRKVYNVGKGAIPRRLLDGFIGMWAVRYSEHARKEAGGDRYGMLKLPAQVCVTPESVVELETFRGVTDKLVVRISHDAERDLVLVLTRGDTGDVGLFCKTVWCNLKTDKHATLNHDRLR